MKKPIKIELPPAPHEHVEYIRKLLEWEQRSYRPDHVIGHRKPKKKITRLDAWWAAQKVIWRSVWKGLRSR